MAEIVEIINTLLTSNLFTVFSTFICYNICVLIVFPSDNGFRECQVQNWFLIIISAKPVNYYAKNRNMRQFLIAISLMSACKERNMRESGSYVPMHVTTIQSCREYVKQSKTRTRTLQISYNLLYPWHLGNIYCFTLVKSVVNLRNVSTVYLKSVLTFIEGWNITF